MNDRIKVVFVSNYINHHQISFCNAMYRLLDSRFAFIQTEPMEEERIKMGWNDTVNLPYLHKIYEDKITCERIMEDADLMLFGGTDDETFALNRIATGKPIIRMSERIYKGGQWKAVSPRGLVAKYKTHTKFRRDDIYMLCYGAYVPSDFNIVKAYPDKMLKWGYFPETKEYDIDDLIATKQSADSIEILWAARMIDWKHPEDAVKMASYLAKAGLKFRLNIIGDGELAEETRRLADSLECSDYISFLGYQKPEIVRQYMERASIYIATSDRGEGWGAVINEAMNSGCAVVASHMMGAVPFLIKQGENGYAYKDGDFRSLAGFVKILLEDEEHRKCIAKNAYKTITEEWNAENAAGRLIGFAVRKGFIEAADVPKLPGEYFAEALSGPCSKASVISEKKMYENILEKTV